MKDAVKTGYILISILLLAISCKSDEKKVVSIDDVIVATRNIEFIADPQDIKKHHIRLLPINSKAPDFILPGVDGKFYALRDFENYKVLVIIFTCNHCPTAQAYEDRIIQLVKDYKNESVGIVAISPNSPKTLLLEECGYTDLGDTYEELKIRARDKGFNFPYLYDGDTQETSIKYGPSTTPHAFLFDEERKLRYVGRLDDSEKPGTANANELRSTIDALLLGSEILMPVTKTFGCSVKWGWKKEWTDKVNNEWKEKEVTLENITLGGAIKLMNNNSEKLRLINFWATWCGPCVIEYPEFVNIQRMYMERDFEFISISVDKKDQKEQALKFLKDKNSALKNYLYSGSDIYKLIEEMDEEWDGALPYTLLVEPGGKVVYRQMGTIDPLELKKVIVDHPMIGRYY